MKTSTRDNPSSIGYEESLGTLDILPNSRYVVMLP